MAKFKAKAATVATPDELWAIQDVLARKQREVEQKYDYRYRPEPHFCEQQGFARPKKRGAAAPPTINLYNAGGLAARPCA